MELDLLRVSVGFRELFEKCGITVGAERERGDYRLTFRRPGKSMSLRYPNIWGDRLPGAMFLAQYVEYDLPADFNAFCSRFRFRLSEEGERKQALAEYREAAKQHRVVARFFTRREMKDLRGLSKKRRQAEESYEAAARAA